MGVITSPTRPHRLDLVRSVTKSSTNSSISGPAKCAEKGHKGRLVFKPSDYGFLINPYTMIWRIYWIREHAEIKCKRCDLVLRKRSIGGCCPFSKTHKAEEQCDKVAETNGQGLIRSTSAVPPSFTGSERLPPYDEAVPVPSEGGQTETWKESELKLRTALPQA